jgi:drug/metabolite transporter (DMT)-like permease
MTGPALALGAAVLFGVSAPAAKLLVGAVDPWLLAGLLYLGSGIGLGLVRLGQRALGRRRREAGVTVRDLPWLLGAIITGGIVGPVLLMSALARGPASEAALLLNLEGVLTALIAWVVFREHCHGRIVIGMVAITAGAFALAWKPGAAIGLQWSSLLVVGACLAWAIDNNLTRAISGADAVQIAAVKGAAAGTVNTLIAVAQGAPWPPAGTVLAAAAVGLVGYGTSLVLFVLALRHLGTSRTGAYFSSAPFIGAVVAVVALGETVTPALAAAAALMALGMWLHLTEEHDHGHLHQAVDHEHAHRHDEHHVHAHPPGVVVTEPHTHRHVHAALQHRHAHYPDIHHRHEHDSGAHAPDVHPHRRRTISARAVLIAATSLVTACSPALRESSHPDRPRLVDFRADTSGVASGCRVHVTVRFEDSDADTVQAVIGWRHRRGSRMLDHGVIPLPVDASHLWGQRAGEVDAPLTFVQPGTYWARRRARWT